MACRCPRHGLTRPAPSVDAIAVRELPHVAWKARTMVGEPGAPIVVEVDAPWWARLDGVERLAVLAHEAAHHERGCASGLEGAASGCPPVACEACADRRAGAVLRAWGVLAPATLRAFRGAVRGRLDAAHDALEGWHAWGAR